ncbi:MAG: RNA-binding domain-containing protein [Anaerolineae bacterium]
MIFGGRSLQDLSLDDLKLLVENRVPEGPHLDYKELPYGGRPQDRREMLRDIVALANADGGYLIIGIREDLAGRATELAPIDDPEPIAQSMQLTCLDGIRDRIEGLEVRVFEMGFNQGVVAVRVPPSDQRPHMVIVDGRTEFVRRYDTDKRPMTIAEIRQSILANPAFRRLVELELQARSGWVVPEPAEGIASAPYAQILTERPVERFLQRYLLGATRVQALVLVSPFISDLAGGTYDLADVLQRVNRDLTRTYVVTREPREEYQHAALALLTECPHVEIRYNPDVHAKLYVCWSRDEVDSFALFGSGNLTTRGLRHNLELGMLILSRGYGRTLVRELYQWGSHTVRTMSQRIKAITA